MTKSSESRKPSLTASRPPNHNAARVWREELLFAASSKGLPISVARWLRDFLSNRTARVQINGQMGYAAPPKQGFPQGAVLSPLPFLLYIAPIQRSVVLETVKVALFADDVSLISSHHNQLVAEKELQHAVIAVSEWSTSKKMVLNADKCEVTFFSPNSFLVNWQPTIIANNTRSHHNPQPKFLRVTLDRLLTFGPHI